MRKYLKYILMGILAVTLSSIFFKKKTEAETSLPRDYAEIAASGILRAVTEYNSISFYADGDTVSGFHYELLHAFAHSKGLKPEITPEMSFSKRLEGVQKGTYDILANSTVVTTEYKDSLLFTRPIILNKQVLVQRKPEKENDSLYIHSQLELARKTLHLVKNSPASRPRCANSWSKRRRSFPSGNTRHRHASRRCVGKRTGGAQSRHPPQRPRGDPKMPAGS